MTVAPAATDPYAGEVMTAGASSAETSPGAQPRLDRPLLSLFCGPGGLDQGFEVKGFTTLLAVDSNAIAVETYNFNRPASPIAVRLDLATTSATYVADAWSRTAEEKGVEGGPVGVIGGPPCQAFSISNVHKFENDPRAKLPLAYAAILKELTSRWEIDFFLFENVAGLGSARHSDSLEEFKSRFADAGFENVGEFTLDAVDFDVPQHRRRMFIVGTRAGAGIGFVVPTGNGGHARTVNEAIGALPEPAFFRRDLDASSIPHHPNHWCMNPRSRKFGDGSLAFGTNRGRSLRILDPSRPSWTVAYGHREVHVHPNGRRRLSVYEAMLLQGFPDDYRLCGTMSDQFRQVSDAVPPPLAAALAESVRNMLDAMKVRLSE